ncbi:MAG: DUF4301 family protein [Bacteroidetes bacterium]|nr:MAG: DUF4301 family protein [Bacteroidota bacterium]
MEVSQLEGKVEEQRKKVFDGKPRVKLVNPCKIGNGIVNFSLFLRDELIKKYEHKQLEPYFFIPASGSGSRMFQFLYEFLDNPNGQSSGQIERFFNHIEDFAFYQKVPQSIKDLSLFEDSNLEKFIRFLLEEEGLGLAHIPKGLIPFHRNGPFILNAFQEQALQAARMGHRDLKIHFTINKKYENEIRQCLKSIEDLIGSQLNISFSIQDPDTDAFAFDQDGNPVMLEDGNYLRRPAGHGALLRNLNEVNAEIAFIKNIDNLQNFNKSRDAENTLKYLGGIVLWFKEEASKIMHNPSLNRLRELNKQFQFIPETVMDNLKEREIRDVLNRPVRVCGMVRNEGQPGGGPFWIDNDGVISKQIVEKAQIANSSDQFKIMVQSTHFNPVMIAASTRDFDGNKYNLDDFVDHSKYFVVHKQYQGKDIHFSELPGLWNGSMAHWNTIFVEIPSETFSPVKTVLDLLDAPHQEF